MKNLFLNVLRSLKRNKLAIIGLTFLVFLSSGVFISLNSTTTAIKKEFNNINKDGNLHDFTVSELYETSSPTYSDQVEKYTFKGQEYYTDLYDEDHLVLSNDGQIMPYIEHIGTTAEQEEQFKLYFSLDVSDARDTSSVKNFYVSLRKEAPEGSSYLKFKDIIEPEVTFSLEQDDVTELISYIEDTQKPYGESSKQTTDESAEDILDILSVTATKTSEINKQLENAGKEVLSNASTNNTPMQQYLSDPVEGLGNEVTYRKFRSINIDNSADSVFYKGVTSNPEDKIDKMVLVKLKSKEKGVEWNNFSVKDCTYGVLDYSDPEEWDMGKTLKYLPASSEISQQNVDIHFIKKIFLLSKCDFGTAKGPVYEALQPLVDGQVLPTTQEQYQQYWIANFDDIKNLIQKEENNNEAVYNKDYRITIQWTGLAPSTAFINDWTSNFAVVDPEYMEKNNLHTMSSDMYENEASYKEYIKQNPGITDQKQRFIGWLNSLTHPEIDTWFKSVQSNPKFANEMIKPGGGTPYIILASGITPDFAYPIVSIQRSTPNPKSECIFFANDSGYARIFDGFRSNETENYLVGEFNKGTNHDKILNSINTYAHDVMIYPSGTKAAYLADDTSNTLNAAAFRISFVPDFISKIDIVSITLTVFIVILSLVICAIVIHRYIVNNQSMLGILRANGVSRSKIAASMLPFALIPSVGGGLLGVIIGTVLQLPVLNLFKNYWMLPTATMGFSFLGLLLAIVISFLVFFLVIWITTFWILRKKTVDLMKTDSQDNPNMISKAAKATVSKFGIVVKYRMSVAFSSLWKLIVLTLMTTLTLSSLVFAFSIKGKFESAITSTTNSRNYDYAVKLQTPTIAGGQFSPMDYYTQDENGNTSIGKSGYSNAGNDNRDYTYLQAVYMGGKDQTIPGYTVIGDIPLPGIEYDPNQVPTIDVTTRDEENPEQTKIISMPLNTAIERNYYYASMAFNHTLNHPFIDAETFVRDNYENIFKVNDDYLANLFMPFMDDDSGQKYDMFYLKDRIQTKDTIDYTVGMPAMGIASNPWDIAASQMPDNNRNLSEGCSSDFVDFCGRSICDPQTEQQQQWHDKILQDPVILDLIDQGVTSQEEIMQFYKYDEIDEKYKINNDNVVEGGLAALCLSQPFIRMMVLYYSNFNLANTNYYESFKLVPLYSTDETYTYIDAENKKDDSDIVIMGVKADPGHETKYVNLKDDDGKDLISKLHYTYEDLVNKKPYPIIINEYVAQKYHWSVGSTVSVKVNNRADRYLYDIKKGKGGSMDNYEKLCNVDFKVAGICTTYQGQEYFVSQDVANYILKLKSHLLDGHFDDSEDPLLNQKDQQPDELYGYAPDTMGVPAGGAGFVLYSANDNTTGQMNLINLKDYQPQDPNCQLTAYGFNGVFTKNVDGKAVNPILTKGINLYAPSGIWVGSDRLDSDALTKMLSFGSNLRIACKLLYNDDTTIPIAKKIIETYNDWQAKINAGESKDVCNQAHAKLEECVAEVKGDIIKYFGTSSYELILSGAIDKTSTSMVYNTLSDTISTITDVVIGFVIVMVVIIVALLTNMIINDSRRLAALLKTLGYSDNENIITYLSIYIPVIILGLGLSALLTWGLVSAYNAIILNGLQIWIDASIQWYYYLIGLAAVGAVFAVSGVAGAAALKKSKVSEEIKR